MGKKSKFYAVGVGRRTGIFTSWDECEAQVKRFSGAKYKSFATRQEAQAFVQSFASSSSSSSNGETNAVVVDDKKRRPNDEDAKVTKTTTRTQDKDSTQSSATKRKTPGDDVSDDLIPRKKKPRTAADEQQQRWRVAIMFDGGARGNPGIAGAGALVTISSSSSSSSSSKAAATPNTFVEMKKIRVRHYLGPRATNNEAEYCGLVKGLEATLQEVTDFCANNHQTTTTTLRVDVIVQGDSQLIIKQLRGEYKCKHPNLKVYHDKVHALVQQLSASCTLTIEYQHVLRAYNSIADGLANQAMDAQKSWVTVDADNESDNE